MSETGISPAVIQFLHANIDSVLELEVLLLMRANAERSWTAREVSETLKIDPAWAQEQLSRLLTNQMLNKSGEGVPTFRFSPSTSELAATIDAVANAYATHRVTIVGLIFSKPVSRLKSFVDAFRIRKEPP